MPFIEYPMNEQKEQITTPESDSELIPVFHVVCHRHAWFLEDTVVHSLPNKRREKKCVSHQ